MLVGTGMTDEELFDELATLLIGGIETTASTLGWLFWLLSVYPDAERRVQSGADEVLGGRIPEYDDLEKMPYRKSVVKETLRLYPQSVISPRLTLAPATLGTYQFPVGTWVFFCPYALHRDPALYPEPPRFDPGRWLDDRARRVPPHGHVLVYTIIEAPHYGWEPPAASPRSPTRC